MQYEGYEHTFGPYCLMNHSEVLGFDVSNMAFSSPRRPITFAMMSALTESGYLQTSSASIVIMSAPASKHLSALLIKKSTSSTRSVHYTVSWYHAFVTQDTTKHHDIIL